MSKHDPTVRNIGAATIAAKPRPFQSGDQLSGAEFLRLWEQHPEIKFAELIDGIVYMPSPFTRQQGVTRAAVSGWLCVYHAYTPGTEAGSNSTLMMGDHDAPQPDNYLRITPEYRGRSHNEGSYVGGSPELIAETCVASSSHDLSQKFDLYERAGVLEYVAIFEQEIRWHRLTLKGYKLIAPSDKMIWKSKVFPGLWLDGKAMLAGDAAKLLATLQKGLRSPEHAAFVKKLAKRKKKP